MPRAIRSDIDESPLIREAGAVFMWQERIAIDPSVLTGKPVIKGTRIAVEFLLELLAEGWSHEEIAQNYPSVTEDDIQAALHYAADTLKRERVFPLEV